MKYGMILMILCAFALSGFSQNDKMNQNKTSNQVPTTNQQARDQELSKQIHTYVSTNFPNNKIIRHQMLKDDLGNSYNVYLDNDVSLGFNRNNEIIAIKGNGQLPDVAVSPTIRTYIKSNHADNTITEWNLRDDVQTITLDNGQTVNFNKNGDYMPPKK